LCWVLTMIIMEIAHMMGNSVEDFLEHDCLHTDVDHLEETEGRAPKAGVNPLVALSCTCKESILLTHVSSQYLNCQIDKNENTLETNVGGHLVVEHLLRFFHMQFEFIKFDSATTVFISFQEDLVKCILLELNAMLFHFLLQP